MNGLKTVSLFRPLYSTRTFTTYNGALHAISILYGVVAVVPCRSVLSRIKGIVERVAGCDGTLSYAIDAVHVHSSELPDPMPVDACTVPGEVIDDVDIDPLNIVSFAKFV